MGGAERQQRIVALLASYIPCARGFFVALPGFPCNRPGAAQRNRLFWPD
jgi:hypothetical protein